jgi:hypothetical protein
MKNLTFGFAAAALLGLSALSFPANAMPVHPMSTAATSEIIQARYHHYRPHKVCTVRTVVRRGHHGRRVVKKVRVCRTR